MEKTVESYRIAIEDEIHRWNSFSKALRTQERQAFQTLMDACRSYASAAGNATNPTLFEPMALSIMLHQQMCINKLEKQINDLKQSPNLQP